MEWYGPAEPKLARGAQVMRPTWIVLPLLAAASSAESPERLKLRLVELPAGLFAPGGSAIAYSVEGPATPRLQEVRFPLEPLIGAKTDGDRDFALLALSNGRYWPIPWQRHGEALLGRVTPGLSYVIARAPEEHLRRSLAALCRLGRPGGTPPDRTTVQKICTQILCAPDPFYGSALVAEYAKGPLGTGLFPRRLGGWRQIPRDLCSACATGLGSTDLWPLTIDCVTAGESSSCSQGSILLHDDFEADTRGSSPGASPRGTPPDDAIAATGNVKVVFPAPWDTQAVRLERSVVETGLDGILGAGAASTGSYCLSFRGFAEETEAGIRISLLDAQGRAAWHLAIGPSGSHLSSGSGAGPLDLSLSAGPHEFRFDIDLDLGRFNLFVDDTLVALGLELLSADFTTPERIRMDYIPMIVEGFPGAYVMDDVVVRRTH
jgi:hypothetical protein